MSEEITDEMVSKIKILAESGNAEGQRMLGTLHRTGTHFSESISEAMRWYRLAADQGNATAQGCLAGCLIEIGKPEEAIGWLIRAAEQGSVEECARLAIAYDEGTGIPKDRVRALKWYHVAAEKGDAHSQVLLGMAYDDGDGVAEDLEKAAFWYRKAAEQSFAGGEYLLGRAFCFGRGVPENITEGREWVTKAADQGYEPAHALLREFSN